MTIDDDIDALARKLTQLEALDPLDPAWPQRHAEVQRMHGDLEARIKAEIRAAAEEFENVCAGLDPAVREKLMADLISRFPDHATFIQRALQFSQQNSR
jgi:hypothetical protein